MKAALSRSGYQGFPATPAPPPPGTAIAAATVPTITGITTGYPQQPLVTAALPQHPHNGTFHHPTTLTASAIQPTQQLGGARQLVSSLHPVAAFQKQNGTIRGPSPGFQKFHPRYNRSPLSYKGTKRKCDDTASTDSGDSKSDGGETSMQPLYCKICRVTLNAPTQARQHYDGKTHAKKVKLTDTGSSGQQQETGTSGTSQNTATDQVSSTCSTKESVKSSGPPLPATEINPEIYCRICGVSFNSNKQAQQHYQGKNHAKKVRATDGDNGRGAYRRGSRYRCFLCNLHLGSREHLASHLRGPRHQEKLKTQGGAVSTLGNSRWHSKDLPHGVATFGITQIATGPPSLGQNHSFTRAYHQRNNHNNNNNNNNNQVNAINTKKPSQDFSMFRTPSGKYYCPSCNLTMNSENLFAQHVDSRKHKSSNATQRNGGGSGNNNSVNNNNTVTLLETKNTTGDEPSAMSEETRMSEETTDDSSSTTS